MSPASPLPRAGPVEAGPFDSVSNWIQHEYATEALRATLDVLEGEGIPVLPVKGVVLARTLYDDVAERPMVDIDLRVRPGDLRRVVRIAERVGWELEWASAHLRAVRFRHEGVLVEIETSIGPPGLCALTVDEMLARARWREDKAGLRFREPEIHDHAVQLCMNVFKDFFRSRPWAIEDLRRIVRAPGFDRDTFVRRCASSGVTTASFAVARWLADVHRDGVWSVLADDLVEGAPRRGYLQLYEWLRARRSPPVAEILVAHVGSDRLRGRAAGLALGVAGLVRWKLRHRGRAPSP